MPIIGFEWNQTNDVVHHLSEVKDKILILNQSNAYKHNGTSWISVGTVPSTTERNTFYTTHGMDVITESQMRQLASTLPNGKGKITVVKL